MNLAAAERKKKKKIKQVYGRTSSIKVQLQHVSFQQRLNLGSRRSTLPVRTWGERGSGGEREGAGEGKGRAAGRRQSRVPTISLGCRPVAAHAVRNLVGDFNCVKADFFGGKLMSDRLVSQG